MTDKKPRAMRATFGDVKDAQEKLLMWLDDLVEGNRPLEPEKRYIFLRLVDNALLGEDGNIKLSSGTSLKVLKWDWRVDGEGTNVDVQTAADIIRFSAYENRTKIGGEEISQLWKRVRALVLRAIPFATQVAVRSSQELIAKPETEVRKEW